jgi:hypothetical protein
MDLQRDWRILVVQSRISGSLFPVSFRFSIGRTRPFGDALAEISCDRQIFSWEAEWIGVSLGDILHR